MKYLILILCLTNFSINAQTVLLDTVNYTVHDAEVDMIKICKVLNIETDFVLITSRDPRNLAKADLYKGEKAIIFHPEVMYDLRVRNVFAPTFVMAHEVTHHTKGHVINKGIMFKRYEFLAREFQADWGAAIILKKLGATLQETLSAFELMNANHSISRVNGKSRVSHPHYKRRRENVVKAYHSVQVK